MKLYAKEQLEKYIFDEGFIEIFDLENDLIPSIELPSDEEIKKEMEFDWLDSDDVAYLGGAIWMRDKIQGGNNEQQ
jgi:hypothetical protein